MRIFISTDDCDGTLPQGLKVRLSQEGWDVELSPRSPSRGHDSRWNDWHASGCARALAAADVAVSVVTPGWDGSTWMAHEADTAQRVGRPLLLWNPEHRQIPRGMLRYAGSPLPDELDAVVDALTTFSSRSADTTPRLPLADAARARDAAALFPLNVAPEEYAARHAHQWPCFSFGEYSYSDPSLDGWIQRFTAILHGRYGAPSLAELRARYLTAAEREQVAREEQDDF